MFGVPHDVAEKLIEDMYFMQKERVPRCNLCGSDQSRPLYQVGLKSPLKTTMCSSCGLVRLEETLPNHELEQVGKHGGVFVRGMDIMPGLQSLSFERQRARADLFIPFIEEHVPSLKGLRVLDMICEAGGHVLAFNERGCQAEGIDLSDQIEYGISRGVTIHKQHILDFNPDQKYDLLVGVRFINHFADIKGVMLKLRDLLNDGGLMYFETQDFDHALRRKTLRKIIKVDHPYLFTVESFAALCEATGFEIVAHMRDMDGSWNFGSTNHMHTIIRKKPLVDKAWHPDAQSVSAQYDRLALAHTTFLSERLHQLEASQKLPLIHRLKAMARKVLACLNLENRVRDAKYQLLSKRSQRRRK